MALVAIYYLASLIQEKEVDFSVILTAVIESWTTILFVLALMPINWLIETVKWKTLVNSIQELNFTKSFQSILAGILLSLFTPNRIGELGGRLIFIEKEKRATILYMNSICSISQLMITMLVGIWSLVLLRNYLSDWIIFEEPVLYVFISLFSVLLMFVYFYSNQLGKLFDFFSKKEEGNSRKKVSKRSRFGLLTMSLCRYIVFCIQFYLVVQIFEPSISIQLSTSSIALIFILTAVVPTGWISDLPVRTSIAFFVFELVGLNGVSGLTASILLWSINLLLPALISLFLLQNVDWMGKLNLKKA